MRGEKNIFIEKIYSFANKNPEAPAFLYPREISYESLVSDLNKRVSLLESIIKKGVTLIYASEEYDNIITLLALLKLGKTVATCHKSFSYEKTIRQARICGASYIYSDLITSGQSIQSEFLVSVGCASLYETQYNKDDDISQKDIAAIFFTSGSTNEPKGVRISRVAHNSVYQALDAIYPIGPKERVLSAASLGSDYGIYNILFPLSKGAINYHLSSLENNYSLSEFVYANNITILQAMPPVIIELFSTQSMRKFTSLKVISTTGQKMPVSISKEIISAEIELYLMYGMTEYKRIFANNASTTGILESVGKPIEGVEILLEDTFDSMSEEEWEEGELLVSGSLLMDGYIHRERIIEERDGKSYFRTGDIFRRNKEGYYFYMNRRDGVFARNGFKVNPKEIIELALSFDSVLDADIVPVLNDNGSFDPCIVIQSRGDLDYNEIKKKFESNLDWHMVPVKIIVTTDSLGGETGKNELSKFIE